VETNPAATRGDPSVLDVLEGSCRRQKAHGGGRSGGREAMFAHVKRAPRSASLSQLARHLLLQKREAENSANFEGPKRKNAERQKFSPLSIEMCQTRRLVFPSRLPVPAPLLPKSPKT